MLLEDGVKIAIDRIAREAIDKTGFLDLGRLGLIELPTEMLDLQHLRVLNLGGNYRDSDGEWHLTEASIGDNKIEANIPRLVELKELSTLYVANTELSNLAPIANLSKLRSLNFSST